MSDLRDTHLPHRRLRGLRRSCASSLGSHASSRSSGRASTSPEPRPRSPAAISTASSTRRARRAARRTRSRRSASTRGCRSSSSPRARRRPCSTRRSSADVSDVLLLPQLTENVVFAIRKATHAPRRAAAVGSGRAGSSPSSRRRAARARRSIATNLAAALAKDDGRRTLLLDLDLQFGDAAIMLGIEPEKTIFDFVNAPGELDPEKLAGYTTKHKSGLDILPAPLRPEDAELVTEAKLGAPARGRAGVLRRDRRRHVAVLPRADAGDARPDGRAARSCAASTCRR